MHDDIGTLMHRLSHMTSYASRDPAAHVCDRPMHISYLLPYDGPLAETVSIMLPSLCV